MFPGQKKQRHLQRLEPNCGAAAAASTSETPSTSTTTFKASTFARGGGGGGRHARRSEGSQEAAAAAALVHEPCPPWHGRSQEDAGLAIRIHIIVGVTCCLLQRFQPLAKTSAEQPLAKTWTCVRHVWLARQLSRNRLILIDGSAISLPRFSVQRCGHVFLLEYIEHQRLTVDSLWCHAWNSAGSVGRHCMQHAISS